MVSDIEQARLRLRAGLERLSECADRLHRWGDEYRQRAQEEHDEDEPDPSLAGALNGDDADEDVDPRVRQVLAQLAELGESLRSGGGAR